MRVFIAEKPSMAKELAKCLAGPTIRKDGYIETGEGIVTWVYGHILRQAEPHEYEARYKNWRLEDLPIMPEVWKLYVADNCNKQFKVITDLLAKASEIVHAGDPDREGQLLVDEVLDYIDNQKPVKRILLNALDEKSIKKALTDLRDNKNFYKLKQSALARARADWLVGMNLSRAYTISAQRAGHKVTLPIGRVKTPTLALVVRREREIANFKPVDYYIIKADFKHINGEFRATWQPEDTQAGLDPENRLVSQEIAESLIDKFNNTVENALVKACETNKKSEPQRLPFALSTLQVEAGKRYGYDPQAVLDGAQALYEKKLTTYPRSDCDFLPESQQGDAVVILHNLSMIKNADLPAWSAKADVKIKSRAWNDKKITAHHAIIPTEVPCKLEALTELEQKLYYLISKAYIAQFYPIHVYNQTKAELSYAGERFTVSGRVVVTMGWKELYISEKEDSKEDKDSEDSASLPKMKTNDPADYLNSKALKKTTKPLSRFTSSTLLLAMKEIHKYVKQTDLKKQLKDVAGIGTEATRATIIKELTDRKFLTENKKYLYPTDIAYLLVDILPDDITYPDTTAEWETTFNKIVSGNVELESFIAVQKKFIIDLCNRAVDVPVEKNSVQCPKCKKGVLQLRKGVKGNFWGCSRYPECRASCDDQEGKPAVGAVSSKTAIANGPACPKCGKGMLRLKSGINGQFWGCVRYPECKATYNDQQGSPQLIKD